MDVDLDRLNCETLCAWHWRDVCKYTGGPPAVQANDELIQLYTTLQELRSRFIGQELAAELDVCRGKEGEGGGGEDGKRLLCD